MSIFSNLFESNHVKTHRKAAEAAAVLRQAAARDLNLDLNILLKYFNVAADLHRKFYTAGNLELAGQYLDAMEKPKELLSRIERVTPELESEFSIRRTNAKSAADWEKLSDFEIEIRNAFITMKNDAKLFTTILGQINSQSLRQSRSEAFQETLPK